MDYLYLVQEPGDIRLPCHLAIMLISSAEEKDAFRTLCGMELSDDIYPSGFNLKIKKHEDKNAYLVDCHACSLQKLRKDIVEDIENILLRQRD